MKTKTTRTDEILHRLRHWFNVGMLFCRKPANQNDATKLTINCSDLIHRAMIILGDRREEVGSISPAEFEQLMDKLSLLAGEVKPFQPWHKTPH